MFELDIQIKVALHTGAEVNLTPEQMRRIKNYATEILLGAPDVKVEPVTKRRKTKRRKSRKQWNVWTPEYDALIMEIVKRYEHVPDKTQSSARMEDLKKLHKTHLNQFTFIAVYSRYQDINKTYRESKKELKEASTWTPVAVHVS